MIDKNRIPKHIAIVMDGNGRWAEKKKLPRIAGHNAGMLAMKEIVKKCSMLDIENLTVYAFSTENWKRSVEEVGGIFKLLVIYIEKELKELHENNVKVKVLGDYKKLPKEAIASIEKTLEITKDNTGLCFNIALNYGSRAEILRAFKLISKELSDGKLNIENITEDTISNNLYTKDIPDPDLFIRTSGEKRLSNYLLWQSAYSELVFSDVLWPEFTPEELEKAIMEFQNRKRRFGGR
ncbi:isoprenyl transferase [Anaerovorax odorimutans]|uniref:isoprenyl transferase n=1 Tax=Anaerovorax odorimutans TaxID=109327 RepID=UPI000427508E|nr:isoprenyl transferase [Anaerovorax odorimutans]